MRINTNINSMRTQEYMRQNQAKMSNSMDRLSSGKRINNASDDAAGLAIATRMRARESGLGVAANNTQDGISLIRTADSALNSVSNILLRMRDIANQSANGTNTNDNQKALDKEFSALKEQIDYISKNTEFNDKKLLNGQNSTISIQTLDSADTNKQININLGDTSTSALEINNLSIAGSGNSTPLVGADAGKIAIANPLAQALVDFDGTATGATPGDRTTAVNDFKAAFDNVKGGLNTEDAQKIYDAIDTFNGSKSLADAQAIGNLYNNMKLAKDTEVTTAKTQATTLTGLDGIATGKTAGDRTTAVNNFETAFDKIKGGMSKEDADKISAAIQNFKKADGTGNTLENAQAIGTLFTQAAAGTSYNASNAIKAIDAAL